LAKDGEKDKYVKTLEQKLVATNNQLIAALRKIQGQSRDLAN
jgi:hypothetical protein